MKADELIVSSTVSGKERQSNPVDLQAPVPAEDDASEETGIAKSTKATPTVKQSLLDDTSTELTSGVVVPFYSQFTDISAPEWRKVGCGVASLAMLIDYYTESVSVDTLLKHGIERSAYLADAGWTHAGLINLAEDYGLVGQSISLSNVNKMTAFTTLKQVLANGPVMVSVHYTFEPTNPIPHLVVVNEVRDGRVYYNDPAETAGGGDISIEKFLSAWKQRYIEIRPTS